MHFYAFIHSIPNEKIKIFMHSKQDKNSHAFIHALKARQKILMHSYIHSYQK